MRDFAKNRCGLVAVAIAGVPLWVVAQETNHGAHLPPQNHDAFDASAVSPSHRFIAIGMSSVDNVSLAAAAEEAARKVEETLGLPLPVWRDQPLRLVARKVPDQSKGSVAKAQGWVDGQLVQKLIIVNPEKADQEDVLEGLCWLLLNRYAVTRQAAEERSVRLATVPDWLSVGVAQNLYLALRTRDGQVVLRRWQHGQSMSFSELLNLEYLPEGRWAEKAFCSMAIGWFVADSRKAAAFDALFSKLARHERITPASLAEIVLGAGSPVDIEKSWDLWLAHQTEIKRSLGSLSMDKLDALDAALRIQPEGMGLQRGGGVPEVMRPVDFIEYRDAGWIPTLAGTVSLRVRSVGLGEAREFRDVVDQYGRFFDELATRRPGSFLHKGASAAELQQLLDAAEQGRENFRHLVQQRREYVGQFERTNAAADAASTSNQIAKMERQIPRSVLQKYVDEAERSAETNR